MLFAVKTNRSLLDYTNNLPELREGDEEIEFFVPRAEGFTLLRLKPSFGLAVERDGFPNDEAGIVQFQLALAHLKRVSSDQNGHQHAIVRVFSQENLLSCCILCKEAQMRQRLFDNRDNYIAGFQQDAGQVPQASQKPITRKAQVEIYKQALELGWGFPTEISGTPINRNKSKAHVADWKRKNKRLSQLAIEDALGFILASHVRDEAPLPDASFLDGIDRDVLPPVAGSWLIELDFADSIEELRAAINGGLEYRPLLVLTGAEHNVRRVASACFVEIPASATQRAPRNQFNLDDCSAGTTHQNAANGPMLVYADEQSFLEDHLDDIQKADVAGISGDLKSEFEGQLSVQTGRLPRRSIFLDADGLAQKLKNIDDVIMRLTNGQGDYHA